MPENSNQWRTRSVALSAGALITDACHKAIVNCKFSEINFTPLRVVEDY